MEDSDSVKMVEKNCELEKLKQSRDGWAVDCHLHGYLGYVPNATANNDAMIARDIAKDIFDGHRNDISNA